MNTPSLQAAPPDVLLVKDGQARVAIHVAPEIMAEDKPYLGGDPYALRNAEDKRRLLRESVKDLALYLQKISGAQVAVIQRAPTAQDKLLPILIGDYAVKVYGEPAQKSPFQQGWRMVVNARGIGLLGEGNEAISYAIYELLGRLGCRWFMPGELGESILPSKTIRLPQMDVSDIPDTEFRSISYGDAAFRRRNRLGGFLIAAGHALELYLTKEQREQHPEWRAIINGKPDAVRLKWSHPGVAEAVADAIIAKLDKQYSPTISLSPEDGVDFDESEDKAWDAGDWDPIMNQVSLTDRYVKFCNLVVERVTQKYPEVQFGFLAYVQYTRPPVRETKLHPNLVPQIAPITYCRAHAMTDTEICPSRAQIKGIIEGWGKVAKRVSYYNYMYNLAEPSVPYPMIHQMSEELPIIYANNIKYWQPETMPNFESALPGMWLTLRMCWNNSLKPQEVMDEFFARYYGSTEVPMRRYWQIFEDAWNKVPEHAGCGFSYMRRFTPEVMKAARAAITEAQATAANVRDYRRVALQDQSLRQFERFMQLRWDLGEGRLTNIDLRGNEWLGTQMGLSNEFSENFAFSKVYWSPHTMDGTYFRNYYQKPYTDGGRIARDFAVITPPQRQWKYLVADKQDGEAVGWQKAEFDDKDWKTTDVMVDTWSALGLETYYSTVWYRQNIKVPAIPAGKKVFLWVSSTDGTAKVFVNGQAIPYVDATGKTVEFAEGYCQPFSFDITSAVRSGAVNQITIASKRVFLNEFGIGGLIGPIYLYREK